MGKVKEDKKENQTRSFRERISEILKSVLTRFIRWIRSARLNQPHLYLLVTTLLFILSFIMFQWSMSKISRAAGMLFTSSKFTASVDTGVGNFTAQEQSKVTAEVKSLADYFTFFTPHPFTDRSNMNIYMNMASILVPLIGFIAIHVIPIVCLSYNIWFIWNFWLILIKAYIGLLWTVVQVLINFLVVCPLSAVSWDLEITTITPFKSFVESLFWKCDTAKNLFISYLEKYIQKPFAKKQRELVTNVKDKMLYVYDSYIGRNLSPIENKYIELKHKYVTNVIDGFMLETLLAERKLQQHMYRELPAVGQNFTDKLIEYGKKYYQAPMDQLISRISKSTKFYNKYIEKPRVVFYEWLLQKSQRKVAENLINKVEQAENNTNND